MGTTSMAQSQRRRTGVGAIPCRVSARIRLGGGGAAASASKASATAPAASGGISGAASSPAPASAAPRMRAARRRRWPDRHKPGARRRARRAPPVRVDPTGTLAAVLIRRPDQPPLPRAALAERRAVGVLPPSAPGAGDHREEIEDLPGLRRSPRGTVERNLVQLQEIDPAQDALVDPAHEFRRFGPVEPRGVVAAGGFADRYVFLEGRLHRGDGRPA